MRASGLGGREMKGTILSRLIRPNHAAVVPAAEGLPVLVMMGQPNDGKSAQGRT